MNTVVGDLDGNAQRITDTLLEARASGADLVSDGFSIDGVGTWIAATVIVWLAALLAAFILPFLGLRKFLEERRE